LCHCTILSQANTPPGSAIAEPISAGFPGKAATHHVLLRGAWQGTFSRS